jgi:DNA-binding transcriptional LysR family regulator
MPRLAGFYEAHDHIDLDIATSSRTDDMHLGDADFAVRYGSGDWEDVHAELLYMDDLVPVCSPAIAATIHEPRDLLQMKLVHSMRRPAAWQTWFEHAGLTLRSSTRKMELANLTLAMQAAADGLGIAIVSTAYLAADLASGRIVVPLNLVAPTGIGMYLVCDPERAATPPFRKFAEWMRTTAASGSNVLATQPRLPQG